MARFEDRGQAGRAADGPPVRNKGGFNAKPPEGGRGFVAPPPTSRSRQDTVQRGTEGRGGSLNKPPVRPTFGKNRIRPVHARKDTEFSGPDRQGGVDRGRPGLRPIRGNPGEYQQPAGGGAPPAREISAPSSPANVRTQEAVEGAAAEGRIEPPVRGNPGSTEAQKFQMQRTAKLGEAGQVAPPEAQQEGASQPLTMGGNEPIPERAQELQATGEDGSSVVIKDKGPDRQQEAEQQARNLEQDMAAKKLEGEDAAAVNDGSRFRMGEAMLGLPEVQGSTKEVSGTEWAGEIGPGLPANDAGALGVPGGHNSPEDIAHNRGRFDQLAKQHDGDHFEAAMGSGSFPSGNPMAHGQKGHMEAIVKTKSGDGIDMDTMSEPMRRRYKQDAVRQMEEFGAYPGMDDPSAPTPPIRPLSFSFNPFTGKFANPEGNESLLDRFGGGD